MKKSDVKQEKKIVSSAIKKFAKQDERKDKKMIAKAVKGKK